MPKTVVEAMQLNAISAPKRLAVVVNERRVTYGDLWKDAQRFSAYLKHRGIVKGDRVALLLENSPEYIAAYYGTLASGGIVVAMNTLAKARDLVNWIEHSGAKWLVAGGRHPELPAVLETADKLEGCVIVGHNAHLNLRAKDVLWKDLLASTLKENLHSIDCQPEELAAIIYTSGTTGRPKGVTLSHGNLAALVQSVISYLKLTAEDSILNVLPFYYSYGNSILHTHIWAGGRMVLENSLMYPQRVLRKIGTERVTGFSGVPSTYYLLLARTNLGKFDWQSVRYLTQAGGAMTPHAISQVREAIPNAEFIVMYGQTEATARLTYLPPERLNEKQGSVGVAIPGIQLRVVDEKDCTVTPNTVGEICARGKQVMQGYWNDPEGTNKVIRNGWLHTGDLGYLDEDGYLYIVGRKSEMIKTGANRVSPNEIEDIVGELDEVAESAAVGVSDDLLGQVIRVFVVTKPGRRLTEQQVQAYCKKNLASYKVPQEVVFVNTLPRTGSGKLRRFLLQK